MIVYTYFPGKPLLFSTPVPPLKLRLLMDGCRTCMLMCKKWSPVLWCTCDKLDTWLPTASSDWNGVREPDEGWTSIPLCWMSCTDMCTLEGIISLDCVGNLRPLILLSLASSLTSITLLLTLLLSLSFLRLETDLLLSAMIRRLPSLKGSLLLFSLGTMTFHRGSIRLLLWWWPVPVARTHTEWSLNSKYKV